MLGMNSFLWICQCLSRVLRPILGEPAVLPLFLPNVSPLYIFVPGLLAALPETWRYKLGPAKDGYVASQSLLQCLRGKLEPESFVCEPGAPIRRGAHGGGVLSPPARWGSRFYQSCFLFLLLLLLSNYGTMGLRMKWYSGLCCEFDVHKKKYDSKMILWYQFSSTFRKGRRS